MDIQPDLVIPIEVLDLCQQAAGEMGLSFYVDHADPAYLDDDYAAPAHYVNLVLRGPVRGETLECTLPIDRLLRDYNMGVVQDAVKTWLSHTRDSIRRIQEGRH